MNYTIANRATQMASQHLLRYRVPLVGFMALFVCLLLPGAARADTITVTNTLDNGSGSLRDVVASALPGDTVVFDPGVFNVPLTIALNGPLIIGKNLTIMGPADAELSISAQNNGRVIFVGPGYDLTLSDMTIRDGYQSGVGGSGGGILAGGALTLTHVNVISNTASDYGGGVYAYGDLIVSNSLFYSNVAFLDGGALNTLGKLQIIDTDLLHNTAGIRGGAIFAGTSLSLTNVDVISNSAGTEGGGGYTLGDAQLDSSNINSNTAFLSGGGLYISATLQLTGSHINGNTTGGPGGGMYAGGALSLVNTSVISNSSNDNGGGAYTLGNVVVDNSTIFSNVAVFSGGGLFTTATLQMTGTQLNGNLAYFYGGGAFAYDTATLSGGVVQHNRASTNAGGGIYAFNALTMSGTQFISNIAGFRGGGAYVDKGSGTDLGHGLFTINGLFSGNQANTDGGGLDSEGYGGLTVIGTLFTGNQAQGGNGGGAFSFYPADITGATFQYNQSLAGSGGGLYVFDKASIAGTQFLTNTTGSQGGGAYVYDIATIVGGLFRANSAVNADGGGLHAEYTLDVTGTQFLSNTAGSRGGGFDIVNSATAQNVLVQGNSASLGGGFYNDTYSNVTLSNSTLANNTASINGGGIYLTATSTLVIDNSTLSANRATASGGGIYVYTDGGLNAVNVTLSGNTAAAGQGGGLYNGGLSTLANTIVANSSGGSCAGVIASITDNGYNLDSANGCGFSSTKRSLVNALPVLGPLQLNAPGATPTFKLMPGSQAIDRGTCVGAPATDQRGAPRPGVTSPFCDIGAYEAQTPTVDLSISKSVRPLNMVAGSAITYTITFSNVGDAMALSVVITDYFPAGVNSSNITYSGAAINQTSSSPLVWIAPTLPGSQSGVITITGVLNSSLAKGTVITNSAVIATGSSDVNAGNNSASVTGVVDTQADIKVLMQVAGTSTSADLTYTVYFTNAGPSVANGVAITASMPTSLTFQGQVIGVPGLSGPTSTVGALVWFTPTLSAGSSGMIVFQEKKNPGVSGWLTATVVITSTTNDPVGVNNASQVSVFALGYQAYLPIVLNP